ncbi:MAG TPA: hypothetical protein VK524_31540 [Polyangiaceae bacterium]|nr:hypothetical protein [Polyangiaceae bacterium]
MTLRGSGWTPNQELTVWLCLTDALNGARWCNPRVAIPAPFTGIPTSATGAFDLDMVAPSEFQVYAIGSGNLDCRTSPGRCSLTVGDAVMMAPGAPPDFAPAVP